MLFLFPDCLCNQLIVVSEKEGKNDRRKMVLPSTTCRWLHKVHGQKPLHYTPTVVTGSQFVLGGFLTNDFSVTSGHTANLALPLSGHLDHWKSSIFHHSIICVHLLIFGNKRTILLKDVENSIPSCKTSFPFIIPYLHLAFFLSLALSLPLCHPSSWR